MSWPQWPGAPAQQPPVVAAATPLLNPAPAVIPPGMPYPSDQWTQMQQQNWQQWAQWQQQYQQWHQQYGAEYQKSINALAAQQTVVGLPPPLPVEPQLQPPLPKDEGPKPAPPLPVPVPPPQQSQYSSQPPIPNQFSAPPPSLPSNSPQQPWKGGSTSADQKRPLTVKEDSIAKRQMTNRQGWQNPGVAQSTPPSHNEELSEAEKKFDKQFAEWEAQFNKWKEQNSGHPDKQQYKEYEKKWEQWRQQLLDRREAMRRKRLGLPPIKASHGQGFNVPPPSQTSISSTAPSQPPQPSKSTIPLSNNLFNKPPPDMNNEPLQFKVGEKDTEGHDGGLGFLNTAKTEGIPGLDLVKDGDVVTIEDDDNQTASKKGPDLEAISKGINNILGDPKLMSMLSMVSQNQSGNIGNCPKISAETSSSRDQSNMSVDDVRNEHPEPIQNFDDQTRSSFTMQTNDPEYYKAPTNNSRFSVGAPPTNRLEGESLYSRPPPNFTLPMGDDLKRPPPGMLGYELNKNISHHRNAFGQGENFGRAGTGLLPDPERNVGLRRDLGLERDDFDRGPRPRTNFSSEIIDKNFISDAPNRNSFVRSYNDSEGREAMFQDRKNNQRFGNDFRSRREEYNEPPRDDFNRPPPSNFRSNAFNEHHLSNSRNTRDNSHESLSAYSRGGRNDFNRPPPLNFNSIRENFNKSAPLHFEGDRDDYNEPIPPNFRNSRDDTNEPSSSNARNDFNMSIPNNLRSSRDDCNQPASSNLRNSKGDFNAVPNFRGARDAPPPPSFRGVIKDFSGPPPNFNASNNDFQRGSFGLSSDNNSEFRCNRISDSGNFSRLGGFGGQNNYLEDGDYPSPPVIRNEFDNNEGSAPVPPEPPQFDRQNLVDEHFEDMPSDDYLQGPLQEDIEMWKPVTVVDYDHKRIKRPEIDVLVEPFRMFDYRHRPLSRIPYPDRPNWLSDSVKMIPEFDPPIIRKPVSIERRMYEDRFDPLISRREDWYRGDERYKYDRKGYGNRLSPKYGSEDWLTRRHRSRSPPRFERHPAAPERETWEHVSKPMRGISKKWDNEDRLEREHDFDRERRDLRDDREHRIEDGWKKREIGWDDKRKSRNDDIELKGCDTNKDRYKIDNRNVERENFVKKDVSVFPFSKPIDNIKTSNVTLIEDILNLPGRLSRPQRIVIILRGPPGSGKTHLAKMIKDKELENGGSAPRILSLDDYFMVEQEKEILQDGKRIKVKELVYEFEGEMEESYRNSLTKSFKKTITDGYFPFIIVDNVNDKVKYFGEMWSFAKQNGFQVYICQMDLDIQNCTKRNIHNRTEDEIRCCIEGWETTPPHHSNLDATSLLQGEPISEVEMEVISSPISDADDNEDGLEDQLDRSKWDNFDCSINNLARLDGVSKPPRPSRTMEEFLQLDDEWELTRPTKPGQKRVRWADLEERKEQEKMRAIGFVVGQTDWDRMMDPSMGQGALTQTKYIEKVQRRRF